MKKFKLSTIFSILVLSVVMIKFQNCGTAPSTSELTGNLTEDEQIRIIGDLEKNKIAFPAEEVLTKAERDEVPIDGLCSRDDRGSVIQWDLFDPSTGELIDQGESLCERGNFRIPLIGLSQFQCEKSLSLQAINGQSPAARIEVKRACPPLAEKLDENSSNPTFGQQCYFQLEENEFGETSCYQSCYFFDRLESKQAISKDSCSNFQASFN